MLSALLDNFAFDLGPPVDEVFLDLHFLLLVLWVLFELLAVEVNVVQPKDIRMPEHDIH